MNEKIIKEGSANWFHGIGSKGGKLILTNKTLYFEGHNANVGKKEYEVELESITGISTGFPNSLKITSASGVETFAVNGKKEWANAISEAIQELD